MLKPLSVALGYAKIQDALGRICILELGPLMVVPSLKVRKVEKTTCTVSKQKVKVEFSKL